METSPEHQYFQAVEEIFIRLRGAPLLLSPEDWQVTRKWYEAGIPLEVVERALEEVFARRKERGTKRKVQSLRYCAHAVEAAWEEIRSLTAAGRKGAAAPLEVTPRLAALAEALPRDLPDRHSWSERLTGLEGATEEVERRLAALDGELLEQLEAAQDEEDRAHLEEELQAALGHLATRLAAKELKEARHRLLRQLLRQRWHLPVLSLFSPEAEPPEEEEEPPPGAEASSAPTEKPE